MEARGVGDTRMATNAIRPEERTPLQDEAHTLPAIVGALAIVDDASFQGAGRVLRRIKAVRDTITRLFAPHIARAFEAHRALVADRKRLEAPLAETERVLKAKLAAFTVVDDVRRAAVARQQTAAATDARAAQIWTEVEQLEAAGYHAEAAEVATELVAAPLSIVCTPAPLKADGLVRRDRWTYAIVDATQVPREYLAVDHQKLGAVVRALKGTIQIPGIRVWAERTIAASARD